MYAYFKESDVIRAVDVYQNQYGDDDHKRKMLCKNRFLERCKFEPIDGQHFCEAYRIALSEVTKGNLPWEEYVHKFSRVIVHICLFEHDSKYVLEFVRLNNEPYQKKKMSTLAKMLVKVREVWRDCKSP